MEESEGFEPPDLLQSIVFKTTSFDRSDNSPYILVGGGKRTRTSEPEGADLQSAAIATMRYPNFCISFLSCQCEPFTVPIVGLEPTKIRF